MARSNLGLKVALLSGRRPMHARPARKKSLLADTPDGDRTARLCITDFYNAVLTDLQAKEPDLAPWIAEYVDFHLVGCDDFGGRITAIAKAFQKERLNGNASRARWITRRVLRDIGIEERDSKPPIVRKLKLSDQYLRRLIDAGDPEVLGGATAKRARAFALSNRARLIRRANRELADASRELAATTNRARRSKSVLESATAEKKRTAVYAATTKRSASLFIAQKATERAARAVDAEDAAMAAAAASWTALNTAQTRMAKARNKIVLAKAAGRGGMSHVVDDLYLLRSLRGPDADGSVWLVLRPQGEDGRRRVTQRFNPSDATPRGKAREVVRECHSRAETPAYRALMHDFLRRRTYRSNRSNP